MDSLLFILYRRENIQEEELSVCIFDSFIDSFFLHS